MSTLAANEQDNILIEGRSGRPILLDFFRPAADQGPVIIFSHGFKGFKDWGPFPLLGKWFAERGVTFVKYNFSFNGTTPENPAELTDTEAFGHNNLLKEITDLETVIDYVTDVPGKGSGNADRMPRPLCLMGHSRGGGITLLQGARDPRVLNLVTLASVNRFGTFFNAEEIAEWKEKGVRYERNSRTGQWLPMYYQYWETLENHRSLFDIPAAVSKLQKRLLVVHGSGDESVPVARAHELHEWNPAFSELFIVPGAGHTFGGRHPWPETTLPGDLQKTATRILSFIKQ